MIFSSILSYNILLLVNDIQSPHVLIQQIIWKYSKEKFDNHHSSRILDLEKDARQD